MKKLLPVILFLLSSFFATLVFAQTVDDCKDIGDPSARATCYTAKIKDLQGQKRTLINQIAVMDSQINLTESRILATQRDLSELSLDIETANKKISNLEDSLDNLIKVLINRMVATYEIGRAQPFEILLSSNNVTSFFSRLNYLRIAQQHDKQLIYLTQQAKSDYANQKDVFEAKKKKAELLKASLERYTLQLSQEKINKQNLLSVTNNDETRYQQFLREAQAQITAFKSFATSRGGSSILPPQDSPDGWFYNQRDERWGRNLIGSSPEQVWDVGCLVASTAMVLKQRGENLTPADVAARASYFFSDTAYMLIPWAGGRFSSTWGYDQGTIDGKLASGNPVIVGLKAGTYGQHFVVLKSGSNGNYIMNDPWNGANLTFSSYYSMGQIFQYGYLN